MFKHLTADKKDHNGVRRSWCLSLIPIHRYLQHLISAVTDTIQSRAHVFAPAVLAVDGQTDKQIDSNLKKYNICLHVGN